MILPSLFANVKFDLWSTEICYIPTRLSHVSVALVCPPPLRSIICSIVSSQRGEPCCSEGRCGTHPWSCSWRKGWGSSTAPTCSTATYIWTNQSDRRVPLQHMTWKRLWKGSSGLSQAPTRSRWRVSTWATRMSRLCRWRWSWPAAGRKCSWSCRGSSPAPCRSSRTSAFHPWAQGLDLHSLLMALQRSKVRWEWNVSAMEPTMYTVFCCLVGGFTLLVMAVFQRVEWGVEVVNLYIISPTINWSKDGGGSFRYPSPKHPNTVTLMPMSFSHLKSSTRFLFKFSYFIYFCRILKDALHLKFRKLNYKRKLFST